MIYEEGLLKIRRKLGSVIASDYVRELHDIQPMIVNCNEGPALNICLGLLSDDLGYYFSPEVLQVISSPIIENEDGSFILPRNGSSEVLSEVVDEKNNYFKTRTELVIALDAYFMTSMYYTIINREHRDKVDLSGTMIDNLKYLASRTLPLFTSYKSDIIDYYLPEIEKIVVYRDSEQGYMSKSKLLGIVIRLIATDLVGLSYLGEYPVAYKYKIEESVVELSYLDYIVRGNNLKHILEKVLNREYE